MSLDTGLGHSEMGDHRLHASRREAVLQEPSLGALGVAIYNVVDLLPVKKNTRPLRRRVDRVKWLVIHESGALGADGLEGAINSAQYVITHRDFNGFAYHFWIPYYEYVSDGYRVILRGLNDEDTGRHCSGVNDISCGVCLQGNLTERAMSPNQQTCMSALIPHLMAELEIPSYRNIKMHCDADEIMGTQGTPGHKKASCPGGTAKAFVVAQRDHFKQFPVLV